MSSEQKKPTIELHVPIQIIENKGENEGTQVIQNPSGVNTEMPTITTLLQRKKMAKPVNPPTKNEEKAAVSAPLHESNVQPISVINTQSEPQIKPRTRRTSTSSAITRRANNGQPPVFSKELIVDVLDLKQFEKSLSKNKKNPNMKKLASIGFLKQYFSEITLLRVTQSSLQGVLGFGSPSLVVSLANKAIPAASIPGLWEMIHSGDGFMGSGESFRSEDQTTLFEIGFSTLASLGVFIVKEKKEPVFVWIAANSNLLDMNERDLKKIKKIFADQVL